MTKEEIKKALEFCADDYHSCDDCPYDVVRHCTDTLKIDALNLIIEQENEIERLKAEVKQAQIDVLNKVKEKCAYSFFFGQKFITERVIDELIKEVQNDNRRN